MTIIVTPLVPTTSFTRTREQLAANILGKLGVTASGGTGSAADLAVVYEAIDLRLKEMHSLGTFWRKVSPVVSTFTITADTASAAHGLADLLFPISLHILDEPVTIINAQYYAGLGDSTKVGESIYAVHDGDNFIFWPVSSSDRTAKILYQKILNDSASGVAPDVEASMMKSLAILVAYDLADQFGIDEGKIRRWEVYAQKAHISLVALYYCWCR